MQSIGSNQIIQRIQQVGPNKGGDDNEQAVILLSLW